MAYQITLVIKMMGTLLFAGGMIASFMLPVGPERKAAVHRYASVGLLVTWLTGFALTGMAGISSTEAWVIGGLVFSFVTQGALIAALRDPLGLTKARVIAVLSLVITVVLMVFRPSWASIL